MFTYLPHLHFSRISSRFDLLTVRKAWLTCVNRTGSTHNFFYKVGLPLVVVFGCMTIWLDELDVTEQDWRGHGI